MTKWVKWEEDIEAEAALIFGEGPFPVIKETDTKKYIVIVAEVPKEHLISTKRDESIERELGQTFGSKRHCNCKDKHKDYVPMISKIEAKKEISPFTAHFRIKQSVRTPEGIGIVSEIGYKQVKVNIPNKGIIGWDYWFVEPVLNEERNRELENV